MNALLPNEGIKELLVLLLFTLAEFTHTLSINKLGNPDIVGFSTRIKSQQFYVDLPVEADTSYRVHDNQLTDMGSFDESKAKTRVELRPITVNAFLYDVIRISAPVINAKSVYYIRKPNGDDMKLDIKTPKLKHIGQDVQPIVARFGKHTKPIIYQENNYDVYSIKAENKLKEVAENEFMIGPLLTEDHGNWVLSMYTKDLNGNWIEMFQVITVMILEFVPVSISKVSSNQNISLDVDSKPTLDLGDTLNMNIAFPIPELESCELVAPRSTFDRFFDRNQIDLATCGFSVPNITVEDAGSWKIIAVGKIVYEGELNLNIVVNKSITRVVID